MQKIKEYMLKKYKDAQKENGYWLNNMDEYLYTGVDNTKDYEKLVNSITAKEVQDFLAKLLKQNNEIQVIMTVPEEKTNKNSLVYLLNDDIQRITQTWKACRQTASDV